MSVTRSELRLNDDEHPVFVHAFDEQTRRTLLADDSFAWRSVCSLLIMIVSLGLLIGVVAVVIAT